MFKVITGMKGRTFICYIFVLIVVIIIIILLIFNLIKKI